MPEGKRFLAETVVEASAKSSLAGPLARPGNQRRIAAIGTVP